MEDKSDKVRIKDYYDDSNWHTVEELVVIAKVEIELKKEFDLDSSPIENRRDIVFKRQQRKKELLVEKGLNYKTP